MAWSIPRRLNRSVLAVLTTSLVLSSLAPNEAAKASTQAPNTGGPVSLVMPTTTESRFRYSLYGNTYSPYCYAALDTTFQWSNARRMANLHDTGDGDTRGYEHDAYFASYPGDYYGTIVQNIPNYYQDTDFDDTPPPYTRAAGSSRSRNLSDRVLYYFQLELQYQCTVPPDPGARYKVPVSRTWQNGPCFPTIAYCINGKDGWPRDVIPYADFLTLSNPGFSRSYNRLKNFSFEGGTVDWQFYSPPGGLTYAAVYAGGAYESVHFLQFNCANRVAGCSVYQPWMQSSQAGRDRYVHEVALRCGVAGGCPATLAIWGKNPGAESTAVSTTVPGDNVWRVYSVAATNFASHSETVFEVYNNSANRNLDVDFTTLLRSDNCSGMPC